MEWTIATRREELTLTPAQRKKRAEVRRAAYRCFRDRGYHHTTVDDICREAGISKGSLYWHYDSKQDVFIDILDTWANQVMEEMYRQFQHALTQPDYVLAITESVQNEVRRGRAIVPLWVEFASEAQREREVRDALSRFFSRARTALSEMLRPALGRALTEEEIRGLATTIFGAYTGLMIQEICDPRRADAQEAVAEFMAVLRTWLLSLRVEPRLATAGGGIAIDDLPTPAEGATRLDARELDDFLVTWETTVQALARELRRLVLTVEPRAGERIVRGWRVLAFDRGRLFCAIKPQRDAVHLSFHRGAALDDPGHLLRGDGKRARHAVLPSGSPLDTDALTALIRQAADLA